MNVDKLVPLPTGKEPFRRNRVIFLPETTGCYVLTSFDGTILYIGLSVNIRRRFGEHLDTPAKLALTDAGRAIWVHWITHADTNKIERTWMNIHISTEGRLPVLNGAYSPVSI